MEELRARVEAVEAAARAVVTCVGLCGPDTTLTPHVGPQGCIKAMSDALAVLDRGK